MATPTKKKKKLPADLSRNEKRMMRSEPGFNLSNRSVLKIYVPMLLTTTKKQEHARGDRLNEWYVMICQTTLQSFYPQKRVIPPSQPLPGKKTKKKKPAHFLGKKKGEGGIRHWPMHERTDGTFILDGIFRKPGEKKSCRHIYIPPPPPIPLGQIILVMIFVRER